MSKQNGLTLKGLRILANLETFKDQQILKSRSCEGSGDCKCCNLFDCFYNETEVREVKRVYRCPNCDAQILLKPEANAIHYCSCRAINHITNWKIDFVEG